MFRPGQLTTRTTRDVSMSNPPQIWLKYRPVRIGWVVQGRDLAQLLTAASWNTCLWGGRFNPIIPMDDIDLANNLIATFGVDVLIPVAASDATKAFIDNYSHLHKPTRAVCGQPSTCFSRLCLQRWLRCQRVGNRLTFG
jgi:hypothetical protein